MMNKAGLFLLLCTFYLVNSVPTKPMLTDNGANLESEKNTSLATIARKIRDGYKLTKLMRIHVNMSGGQNNQTGCSPLSYKGARRTHLRLYIRPIILPPNLFLDSFQCDTCIKTSLNGDPAYLFVVGLCNDCDPDEIRTINDISMRRWPVVANQYNITFSVCPGAWNLKQIKFEVTQVGLRIFYTGIEFPIMKLWIRRLNDKKWLPTERSSDGYFVIRSPALFTRHGSKLSVRMENIFGINSVYKPNKWVSYKAVINQTEKMKTTTTFTPRRSSESPSDNVFVSESTVKAETTDDGKTTGRDSQNKDATASTESSTATTPSIVGSYHDYSTDKTLLTDQHENGSEELVTPTVGTTQYELEDNGYTRPSEQVVSNGSDRESSTAATPSEQVVSNGSDRESSTAATPSEQVVSNGSDRESSTAATPSQQVVSNGSDRESSTAATPSEQVMSNGSDRESSTAATPSKQVMSNGSDRESSTAATPSKQVMSNGSDRESSTAATPSKQVMSNGSDRIDKPEESDRLDSTPGHAESGSDHFGYKTSTSAFSVKVSNYPSHKTDSSVTHLPAIDEHFATKPISATRWPASSDALISGTDFSTEEPLEPVDISGTHSNPATTDPTEDGGIIVSVTTFNMISPAESNESNTVSSSELNESYTVPPTKSHARTTIQPNGIDIIEPMEQTEPVDINFTEPNQHITEPNKQTQTDDIRVTGSNHHFTEPNEQTEPDDIHVTEPNQDVTEQNEPTEPDDINVTETNQDVTEQNELTEPDGINVTEPNQDVTEQNEPTEPDDINVTETNQDVTEQNELTEPDGINVTEPNQDVTEQNEPTEPDDINVTESNQDVTEQNEPTEPDSINVTEPNQDITEQNEPAEPDDINVAESNSSVTDAIEHAGLINMNVTVPNMISETNEQTESDDMNVTKPNQIFTKPNEQTVPDAINVTEPNQGIMGTSEPTEPDIMNVTESNQDVTVANEPFGSNDLSETGASPDKPESSTVDTQSNNNNGNDDKWSSSGSYSSTESSPQTTELTPTKKPQESTSYYPSSYSPASSSSSSWMFWSSSTDESSIHNVANGGFLNIPHWLNWGRPRPEAQEGTGGNINNGFSTSDWSLDGTTDSTTDYTAVLPIAMRPDPSGNARPIDTNTLIKIRPSESNLVGENIQSDDNNFLNGPIRRILPRIVNPSVSLDGNETSVAKGDTNDLDADDRKIFSPASKSIGTGNGDPNKAGAISTKMPGNANSLWIQQPRVSFGDDSTQDKSRPAVNTEEEKDLDGVDSTANENAVIGSTDKSQSDKKQAEGEGGNPLQDTSNDNGGKNSNTNADEDKSNTKRKKNKNKNKNKNGIGGDEIKHENSILGTGEDILNVKPDGKETLVDENETLLTNTNVQGGRANSSHAEFGVVQRFSFANFAVTISQSNAFTVNVLLVIVGLVTRLLTLE